MKDPFAKERAIAQAKKKDPEMGDFFKHLLAGLKGDLEPMIKANKGKDGFTPVKGKDYFTNAEIEALKSEIKLAIPKGDKGDTSEIDYDLLFAYCSEQVGKIPKPKDGVDGKDAVIDTAYVISEVLKQVPKIETPTINYKEVEDFIEEKIKKISPNVYSNERRVVGYSSLKQLTDVILDGVPQDSKGNYILAPGGGGSKHVIKDETISLPARTNLNFTGAGVTATDNAGTDSTDITITSGGGSGDVVGPASATADAIPLYNGTTGKIIKNSALTANAVTSTGVISGGYPSIGSPTSTFTISDGTGIIVNAVTNVATAVSWTGKTNIAVTNIATQGLTYIKIDSAGTVTQQSSPFTPTDFVDYLPIGVLVHPDLTTVTSVISTVSPIVHANPRTRHLTRALGLFNITGNAFSANGANLSINKASGSIYNAGANWATDNKVPDVLTVSSATAPTVLRLLRGGTATTSTFIDPDNYDLAGVLTAVGNNKWTVQHIVLFADGTISVQYGQNIYNSFALAQSGVQTETFVNAPNIEFGLFRTYLIVKKGSTDLAADVAAGIAQFIDAGKFGESTVGAGASTTTLQQAYDNSTDPEILTDAVRDGFTLRRGSAADTDKVLDIQNGAGTPTASITGAGVITGSNLTGTNTGDQTTIVGITGTKAQFDTAVTDGNILYVGDVTQYTDEQAQDAVGAMVATSIVYNDAGATLQRAALTGAITASQDSNTTALGSFTKSQLDTAVSDGNVMYIGDAPTAHTHLLAAGATDVTMTATNLNILDDGLNTTLHFHDADRARANHTGSQLASTISDFASTVRSTVLTGLSLVSTTVISATDTVLVALGSLQAQITALTTTVSGKVASTRTINTTAPLSGGGDLSADRTLTTSMATNKLIGRGTAGTGVMEEITLGTNLSFTGTTLNAAGGGGATTLAVAQTAHGLVAGNLIRSNGTADQYAVADKDAGSTADAVGYVTAVADANNFTYQPFGFIVTNNVPVATAGSALFVGDSGAFTTTEPIAVGEISKPVGIVLASATRAVVFNMRGMEVTPVTTTSSLSVSNLVPTGDETLSTGYSAYVSDYYNIASTFSLDIGLEAVFEIG